MSSQRDPTDNPNPPSASASLSNDARDPRRRLALAFSGVLGSVAGSARLAARVQHGTPRGVVFEHMAQQFSAGRESLQQLAATLPPMTPPPTAEAPQHEAPEGVPANLAGQDATAEPSEPGTASTMATSKLRPISIPLPRLKRQVGLGEAVSKLTTAVGIRTCGGCARRAAALNRAVVFRPTGKVK